MQNLKLSIQEAQEMLLMSQSSVYAWIDKGKLHTTEGPGGKIILITQTEANQIRELNLKSKRNKASKQFQSNIKIENSSYTNSTNSDNLQEFSENTSESQTDLTSRSLTARLITELKELAVEAGKYKQLEIIRNEEKENVKYWENKFFEVSQKLYEKDYEITALKQQISGLQQELEQTKKPRSWFFKK